MLRANHIEPHTHGGDGRCYRTDCENQMAYGNTERKIEELDALDVGVLVQAVANYLETFDTTEFGHGIAERTVRIAEILSRTEKITVHTIIRTATK